MRRGWDGCVRRQVRNCTDGLCLLVRVAGSGYGRGRPMSTDQAAERAGEGMVLGPFVLERPIGSGGMGEVWRAVHVASGVPVAIKVIASAWVW